MPERAVDSCGLTAIKPKLTGLRKARWIDVIFVYKVDRPTRSLPGFAKPVEFFDEPRVSFVSVPRHSTPRPAWGG
jgi:site-specific DNA recombinase